MGYTVESVARLREHYDTKEQVVKALERINRGVMPQLLRTSDSGIETYRDWLKNVITVTPDPVNP